MISLNMLRIFSFDYNMARITGTLLEDLYTYDSILLNTS